MPRWSSLQEGRGVLACLSCSIQRPPRSVFLYYYTNGSNSHGRRLKYLAYRVDQYGRGTSLVCESQKVR